LDGRQVVLSPFAVVGSFVTKTFLSSREEEREGEREHQHHLASFLAVGLRRVGINQPTNISYTSPPLSGASTRQFELENDRMNYSLTFP
jgi:hypothetical protein